MLRSSLRSRGSRHRLHHIGKTLHNGLVVDRPVFEPLDIGLIRGLPSAACRELSSDVNATTVAPTSLPIRAASMGAAFTPEFYTMISMSLPPTPYRSRSGPTIPAFARRQYPPPPRLHRRGAGKNRDRYSETARAIMSFLRNDVSVSCSEHEHPSIRLEHT